ncbi:pilus assembly protein TadE [Massilia sp. R798]|uniref:Pilus assembly protein TadE n=2 Tax=Massilia soli TaxID=2792854 RepID=A0ABS7SIN2_9BURK|nr:pilus assembly protein TadE [Massilia soli]
MYVSLLIPIIGFAGLALDLSFAYTRRTELQSLADAAAMAAARALDGTEAGITAAKTAARTIAERQRYSFGKAVVWDDDALRFSDSPDKPDGDWLPAAAINATRASSYFYVRVDTRALHPDHGISDVVFMRVLGGETRSMSMAARAIAGRTGIQVTPLAVCAIKNTAVSTHDVKKGATVLKELAQYGFRRGVSYNLLNMNPHGTTAVSYLVNPLDFPNQPETASHRSLAMVRPFVCNGSIAASNLRSGAKVYVADPFPATLATELNSRFGSFSGSSCDAIAAPSDRNIREFNSWYFNWWMNSTGTINGSAQPLEIGGAKLTVAEQSDPILGITRTHYGPLWSFSKAVYYDSGAADGVGAPFSKDDWPSLYPVGSGTALASAYSDTAVSPYSGLHLTLGPSPFLAQRRVLNVPLLACPVAGSTATVLAIGRFFMSSRADAAAPAVHGEFAGLLRDNQLPSTVGLYK